MEKDEWNYLTEDELMQLISDVEEQELVAAPPDFMEQVLAALYMEQKAVPQPDIGLSLQENSMLVEKPPEADALGTKESRRREYRRYCIRVLTSVAAAVFLVFLLPEVMWMAERTLEPKESPEVREEVLEQSRYDTKEEAMQSRGFLSDRLGKVKLFEMEWNFFEKWNGGFEDETT